jgi:hypothetical protein
LRPAARASDRGDQVDLTVHESAPEAVAIAGAADRRSALERRGTVGDVVPVERQVMRTGLARNRDAAGARGLIAASDPGPDR